MEEKYFLYLIGARTYSQRKSWHYAKVGHSNNLKRRFNALDAASPMTLKLLMAIESTSKSKILELENKFKKQYRGFKVKREWFHYDDCLLETFKEFANG